MCLSLFRQWQGKGQARCNKKFNWVVCVILGKQEKGWIIIENFGIVNTNIGAERARKEGKWVKNEKNESETVIDDSSTEETWGRDWSS